MPRIVAHLMSWLTARLRFPWLFVLTAAVFVADLLIPDAIPFVDELLLGLLTALFGVWRRRRQDLPKDGGDA
ncbi:MAG: hypothetical protein PVI30_22880 [Myxococcales bacterium]|jgi:hypothetical protein